MQLLPATARDVAGKLSLPFIQDKLTSDPAYNVALGSQYLAQMLQRFGGSYEIALAAYNAGPNRVARWLDTMGDPRGGKIDMVDWIEMIPLRETRNYVQRIMEGVGVYRDRLNGPVPPAAARHGPQLGTVGLMTADWLEAHERTGDPRDPPDRAGAAPLHGVPRRRAASRQRRRNLHARWATPSSTASRCRSFRTATRSCSPPLPI